MLFILFIFLNTTVVGAASGMKGPASQQSSRRIYPTDYQTSSIKLVLSGLIQFYAKVISPADGPRSPSYPTGTAYGIEAVKRYGLFPGIIIIGDRLLHESDRHLGPMIIIYGKRRYYDPPEFNTYWWDSSVLPE